MLAVAAIYFVLGAVGIVSAVILLVAGDSSRLWAAAMSAGYVLGACYFLKGSIWSKNFLVAMSAIGAVFSVPLIPFLLQPGRITPLTSLFLFFGLGLAYCFYALIFSGSLKREFKDRKSVV